MLIRRRPSRRAELRRELGFASPSRAGTAVLVIAALLLLGVTVYSVVASGGEHQAHSAPVPVADEGLEQVHDGYRLELLGDPAVRGPATPVVFRIIAADGRPVHDYDVGHTKLMHFYVVRDDMSHYQHLHPELTGDTWHTVISVPDGGLYRLYAEFLPRGRADATHPIVLGAAFTVPGDTAYAPLPPPAASAAAGPFTVSRSDGATDVAVGQLTELRFQITGPDGRPVTRLGSYLGAAAHMSAFNAISMGLLHQHPLGPAAGELSFSAQFPNRGEHRLFLEFSVDGQVHRAELTVFVT